MTITKIQQTSAGQYLTTVPKQVLQAMGAKKGTKIIWKLISDNKLQLELKIREDK